MIAVRAIVTGRVQGVGFRWSTRHEARRLGVAGWVRNKPDGTVEVHAEGDAGTVRRFMVWLGVGPPPARVDGVTHVSVAPSGTAVFDIVD